MTENPNLNNGQNQTPEKQAAPTSPANRTSIDTWLENWGYACVSGLIGGAVMAAAFANASPGAAFMISAIAYGFCIQNFPMSGLQKLFATGLMLLIGTHGREIAQWMMRP